jgi:c-di-GMP-related signal transduction protein
MAQDRPPELMRQAALRGRFCELLAPEWKRSADPEEMFFVGIFSLLDAFTSTPLESLLRELPLSNEVRLTLLGKETTYSIILDTVNAFERADWEFLQKVANEFRISDQVMSECYLESIIWIDNLLK